MNVQAIILAAGTGSRLGRISKPLLKISGKTLLRRQIESLEQSGIANIMVVTGFESEKLVLELSNTSVATIHNPAFENGNHQHSLELAVRALPLDSSDIVIICLADQVLVDSKAIAALLQNYAKHPESITLIPKNSLDGGRGNPIVTQGRYLLEALDSTPFDFKVYLQQHANQIVHWLSDNPAYFIDLDTSADLEYLKTHLGVVIDDR